MSILLRTTPTVDHLPAVGRQHPPNSHAAAAIIQPKRNTRAAQVLQYLQDRIGQWIPGYLLTTQDVGGSEGLKRLREMRQVLRDHGYDIIEARPPQQEGMTAWEYRLANDD